MMPYLMPVIESVKSVIENGGVQRLYQPMLPEKYAVCYILEAMGENFNHLKSPRYQCDLLLQHWELKDVLSSLGYINNSGQWVKK